jgi:hypothetical protein
MNTRFKNLLKALPLLGLFFCVNLTAQISSFTVFDEVLFYDGYAGLLAEGDLYEPMPAEVLRHSNSRYAIKLTPAQVSQIGNKLKVDVTLKAACDNYDRIARVYLALVPQGQTTYVSNEVDRIELGRFITPFMNKNNAPMEVPFSFTTDNIAEILTDTSLSTQFDFWIELDVFGVPYAAQEQVAGCAGRIDTFYGTVVFSSEDDPTQTFDNPNFLLPLAADLQLNDYNATDVTDETIRILNFTLTEAVDDLSLFLITSNHGANSGGEEYNRRNHFIYLNDELIHQYIPGGKSCEPFRQFNTQGNGIYSSSPRTTRFWLSFNNWCPGDVIPNREIYLGNLPAGDHSIKIDVPDAIFAGNQGYIPVSMYLQNRKGFAEVCIDPTELVASNPTDVTMQLDWIENETATEWEILYGYQNNLNNQNFVTVSSTSEIIDQLQEGGSYSFYVRAICDEDDTSNWVGPINRGTILGIENHKKLNFSFYPNPSNGVIYLEADITIDDVIIYDTAGKNVYNIILNNNFGNINTSTLSMGLYLMEVSIAGVQTTHKLIIN